MTTTATERAKFTPGPWTVYEENCYEIRDRSQLHIADVYALGVPPGEEVANARLIAAAPNFYAACAIDEEGGRLTWLSALIADYADNRPHDDDQAELTAIAECRALLADLRAAVEKVHGGK